LDSAIPRDAVVHETLTLCSAAALTLAFIAIPASVMGHRKEGERHFLKSYHTPDWSEAHIQNQMDYVVNSHDMNDVVFAGDSTTTVGIVPRQFEAATGLRAYNLGLPGFVGIDTNLRVMELYLRSHPRPRLLVYSPHPKDFGLDQPNWGSIRPRFAWSFGVWSGAPPFVPDFSPTYYVREGIRIVVGELRGGEAHYFGKNVAAWKALVLSQRGFFVSPGELPSDVELCPPSIERFEVSSWYAKHLHALARLTLEHGIKLMVRPSPAVVRRPQEDTTKLLAWLQDFEARYPHVHVTSSVILEYRASKFAEEVHLNMAGATAFTGHLAQEVTSVYPDLGLSAPSATSP
jgi:hypothetical protein